MGTPGLLEPLNFSNTYPIPVSGSFLVNKAFNGHETCVDHVFTNMKNISCIVRELEAKNIYLSDHAAVEIEVQL